MKKRRNGRLIVIDGTDGSGKTTQTALLIRRLRTAGVRCEGIEFPQYGQSFFAELVARYLNGEFGGHDDISPYLASILYAGDRWQAKERMERWLSEGAAVVCNRYVSANQGHQGAKVADPVERARFLAWLDRLEFGVFGVPRPDLILFLRVPPELAQKLIDNKGRRAYLKGAKRDIHEASLDHLAKAEETYRQLAAESENWVQIECAPGGQILPEGEIAGMIWKEVARVVKI